MPDTAGWKPALPMRCAFFACFACFAVSLESCRLADDDVHEAAGDDDEFFDRLAGDGLGDFRRGLGDGFDVGLRRVFFHDDLVAEFSVHLHGEFDFVLDEERGIVGGPRGVGEEGVLSDSRVGALTEH